MDLDQRASVEGYGNLMRSYKRKRKGRRSRTGEHNACHYGAHEGANVLQNDVTERSHDACI
jgi:hypothetical protein